MNSKFEVSNKNSEDDNITNKNTTNNSVIINNNNSSDSGRTLGQRTKFTICTGDFNANNASRVNATNNNTQKTILVIKTRTTVENNEKKVIITSSINNNLPNNENSKVINTAAATIPNAITAASITNSTATPATKRGPDSLVPSTDSPQPPPAKLRNTAKRARERVRKSTEAPTTTTTTTTTTASKKSDLSSGGNPWSLGLGAQYQHSYYTQYQYPQQTVYQSQQERHYQPQQESIYQPQQETYYPPQQAYQDPYYYPQQEHQYAGQGAQAVSEHQQQQQHEFVVGPPQQPQPPQESEREGCGGGQCWECGAAFQDVALLRDHLALFHPHLQLFACSLCPHVFPSHTHLAHHFNASHLLGEPVASPEPTQPQEQQHERPPPPGPEAEGVVAAAASEVPAGEGAKPKCAPARKQSKSKVRAAPFFEGFQTHGGQSGLWCILCRISHFESHREFEAHHRGHVRERSVRVRLKHLSQYQLRKFKVKVESKKKNSSLKLKLKISKVGRGRGRKRREVKILSEEGMSDTPNSFDEQEGLEAEPREESREEEAEAAVEREESGGESEEQEASRSSGEAQDGEERLEQDSPAGHDDLGTEREQDGQQEDPDHDHDQEQDQEQEPDQDQDDPHDDHHDDTFQQQDDDYHDQQEEQEYPQEEQEYQQEEGQEYQQEGQEYQEEPSEQQEREEEGYQEAPEAGEQSDGSNSGFNPEFGDQELRYGSGGDSGDNSQAYQPQFESYPTANWFTDYESGPRIAAAMAGATATENASDGGTWAGGTEGGANPSYSEGSPPPEKGSSDVPVNGGPDGEDGLFSQAVLGQESPEKNDRQGSFEQLCLNDSFSGQAEGEGDEDSQQQQQQQQDPLASPQEQQQQASGVASDLLSELEYLNNSGQAQGSSGQDMQGGGSQPGSQSGSQSGQIDGSPHSGGPSPHSGGPSPHSAGPGTPSHLSSRGSNSGTPTSSGGHPTPPPSDTSFRALATSPITSPSQQQPASPSLHKGSTPPATSPHQQMHSPQQAGEQQASAAAGSVPRLTIANNLMASTTSAMSSHLLAATTTTSQAGVSGMMGRYGSQWSQAAGYSGAAAYPGLPGTSIASTNMPGPLRAALPPTVGMQYRPSPPPRVRGRPPLIGHVGRPPLHQAAHLQPTRGPGRPPASSILPPPLMPAPGGRGGMMPPLQRMHQTMYPGQRAAAPQQQTGAGKRQMLGAAGHSPSKSARREDINVPSRQKDNECQIIAVANRSDGLPVISNVQGGSAAPGSQRGSVPATTESTINLSDSITLSVRASANKEGGRGERGGPEAGAVANLLASRGITVTPAAGERQDGSGGRDDRRLPTAQELNLSSAISVHPPTQREREGGGRERDRDGFAVPQAPPTRGSVSNSSVERPPRPPTVDLTQDVPSSGAQGTRHKCHQCDRSFPTASLLADHSRVHQQQQQSRMPFKCHLCTAGFSTQKGQQHHYQQFHQLHLSAGDVAIPLVDLRSPVNVQRMAALGIRSFLPLTNLQNRGAGGVVGVPILTLENLRNGHMTLQQWGVSDVLSLGPAKTLNMPR